MQYNWNIIGHSKSVSALEQNIKIANISHAYLFAGPEKIGKFLVAKKFAQILQCENNFCDTCPTCVQIKKSYHLDTIEIQDNFESLKIEEIREIINRLNLSTQSKYKILLIKNIERMTPEAANALLKTLEEPNGNVIFIFTSSNIKQVLPTLISRCRVVKFQNLSNKEMNLFLETFCKDDLETITDLSFGKPGKVFDLIQKPEVLSHYKNMYMNIYSFFEDKDKVKRFLYAAEIATDKEKVKSFLQVLTIILRKELIKDLVKSVAHEQIKRKISTINAISEVEEMLKRNVNARMAIENIMLIL